MAAMSCCGESGFIGVGHTTVSRSLRPRPKHFGRASLPSSQTKAATRASMSDGGCGLWVSLAISARQRVIFERVPASHDWSGTVISAGSSAPPFAKHGSDPLLAARFRRWVERLQLAADPGGIGA